MTSILPVQLLRPEAIMPQKAHAGDLGFDLCAAQPAVILSGDWSSIQTGIALALPFGCAGLILPRSGLAARLGVTVLNSPGLIDSGYRGEVGVILINWGDEPFHIQPGDRIAQLLIIGAQLPELAAVDVLPEAADDRGAGGFGSSGGFSGA